MKRGVANRDGLPGKALKSGLQTCSVSPDTSIMGAHLTVISINRPINCGVTLPNLVVVRTDGTIVFLNGLAPLSFGLLQFRPELGWSYTTWHVGILSELNWLTYSSHHIA